MKSVGRKSIFAIVLFSLCGQIAWCVENMLFNVFIQKEFNATLSDIALMVSLSAVVATLTTLLMGALSDKIGKRKLFICIGYIVWGLSILAFALLKVENINRLFPNVLNAMALGVGLTIAFDCVMTLFGSTANDASYNAWMTDITDSTNRGKIEGINSAMPLLAVMLVFGLDMIFQTSDYRWTILFITIGVIVIIVGILGFFLIKDVEKEKQNEPYFKNIFYGFRPKVVKENKLLYVTLIGFMIFCSSVQIFMPYLLLYFTNTLLLENYVLIFGPAVILAAVYTFFFGKFIDKKGVFVSSLIALSIYIVGLVLMFFATHVAFIFISLLLLLSGYLSLTACFQAEIRNQTPETNVGLFQGIRIVCQVLVPMLVGPWIGSLLSSNASVVVGVVGDDYIPSNLIFLGSAVLAIFVLGIIFILRKVKKNESKL